MANPHSLTHWIQRLESLKQRIQDSPAPDRSSTPSNHPRMSSEARQHARRKAAVFKDRVDRLNFLYTEFGEMLGEQPAICLAAGISQATLNLDGPGHIWGAALSDLLGPEAHHMSHPGDPIDQRSTIRAIVRLLAVANDHLAKFSVPQERRESDVVDTSTIQGTAQPVAPPAPENLVVEAPIDMGQPGMPCKVNGKLKAPLTDGQRAVIGALLAAGADGMTKDGLESVRASARTILKTLRTDEDWATVIHMPGQTNGRYRVRI